MDLETSCERSLCVAPRRFEHRYSVDHRGGCLYILTNKDGAKNASDKDAAGATTAADAPEALSLRRSHTNGMLCALRCPHIHTYKDSS